MDKAESYVSDATELRVVQQIDNLLCSHRCTSDVHFGQGRVRVEARARPVNSVLYNFFSSPASFSVARHFVRSNVFDILSGPNTDSHLA